MLRGIHGPSSLPTKASVDSKTTFAKSSRSKSAWRKTRTSQRRIGRSGTSIAKPFSTPSSITKRLKESLVQEMAKRGLNTTSSGRDSTTTVAHGSLQVLSVKRHRRRSIATLTGQPNSQCRTRARRTSTPDRPTNRSESSPHTSKEGSSESSKSTASTSWLIIGARATMSSLLMRWVSARRCRLCRL